jgi:hypothetical protein
VGGFARPAVSHLSHALVTHPLAASDGVSEELRIWNNENQQ